MKKNKEKDKNSKVFIRVLILIILLLLVVITSFRTGRKIYLLKNTYLESTTGSVESGVARWNFNARIVTEEEVMLNKNN